MMVERNDDEDYDICKCGICKKNFDYDKLFFVDSCGHTFCRPCLSKHVIKCLVEKKTPHCTVCNKSIQVFECKVRCSVQDKSDMSFIIKDLIGKERYEELLEESLDLGLTQCVHCKAKFAFEPGKTTGNVKDEQGKVLDG